MLPLFRSLSRSDDHGAYTSSFAHCNPVKWQNNQRIDGDRILVEVIFSVEATWTFNKYNHIEK